MLNIITYMRPNQKPATFSHSSIVPMTKTDALRVLRQNGNTYSDIEILWVGQWKGWTIKTGLEDLTTDQVSNLLFENSSKNNVEAFNEGLIDWWDLVEILKSSGNEFQEAVGLEYERRANQGY